MNPTRLRGPYQNFSALLDPPSQARAAKRLTTLLEEERVAYEIDANPSAAPGLRIWCGPTIERVDMEALMSWLDWVHRVVQVEGGS